MKNNLAKIDFLQFKEIIVEQTKEILGKEYSIELQTVQKNNGVTLQALFAKRVSSMISPVFYLEEFYEKYCNGESIQKIILFLVDNFTKSDVIIEESFSGFGNYTLVKNRIVFRIVNYYSNKEWLMNIPHRKILDLAYIYYCRVEIINTVENNPAGNIIITNEILNMWKITEEELYETALENTPAIMNVRLAHMQEIMRNLMIEMGAYDEIEADSCYEETSLNLFVLTNNEGIFGAVTMFYKDILKDFSSKIGKDIYILPCSIHEVLLLPVDFISESQSGELKEIIKSSNDNQLKTEDILSYNLYYYDRIKDEIKIISPESVA